MAEDIALMPGFVCSAGWRITGYYLPSENDFEDQTISVSVEGYRSIDLPGAFVRACKVEGWGQTGEGWFLGWQNKKWVKGDYALDARGGRLDIGVVAVDVGMIALGRKLRIPSAPFPWGTLEYVARDTGSAIKDKHIDVFCGCGSGARDITFQITSDNGTVCLAA